MKTSELIGPALDWAVAKCEGVNIIRNFPGFAYIPKGKRSYYKWLPSSNWKQGGPIIERERLTLLPAKFDGDTPDNWVSTTNEEAGKGTTPLIAAMRCYCCAKLGDEIEIPQELQQCQQPSP